MTHDAARPHLSFSDGHYRIMHMGMPVCADKNSLAEALRVADQFRLELLPVAWNGDLGQWVHLDTVEEHENL